MGMARRPIIRSHNSRGNICIPTWSQVMAIMAMIFNWFPVRPLLSTAVTSLSGILSFPKKPVNLQTKKRPCGRTSCKIEVTLDCFFLRNQPRVTSLNSWYLTSLVNLSFLRSDVPSPDKNWITSGNLFVLYRIIYKRKKYVKKKLLSTLSYGLESCFKRSLVSPLCMFIIPPFSKTARWDIV